MTSRKSAKSAPSPSSPTHEVLNQTPPLENYNLFTSDNALAGAIAHHGAAVYGDDLKNLGAALGGAEALEQGRLANRFPPQLVTHDARGHRLDRIDFHPSYHALMTRSFEAGLHSQSWAHLADGGERPQGAVLMRGAGIYMSCQIEAGHVCPVTMTHAVVPALLTTPALAEHWLPKILARAYDPAFAPAAEKTALTFGMGMTEKQGGSDVRTNTSRAVPAGRQVGEGAEYILTGHKWFTSAPMCDAFLMLAQAEKGLTCFVVPRFLPDGTLNDIRIQRLKDKLGNRSNASAELEFTSAHGHMLGREGRGIATIIEMATLTRVDCALGSAGLMRQGVAHALHHARHRAAFGNMLIDQPIMRAVLCDLALEAEAATALAFRLARAYDRTDAHGEGPEAEAAYRRVMNPVAKYWVCKRATAALAEAMECLGGNGYVEELPVARHYREAPLNAIWEGSGNVMCLDLMRVLGKTPELFAAVIDELDEAASNAPALKTRLGWLKDNAPKLAGGPGGARRFMERLAQAACAAALIESAPSAVSGGYLATRLEAGAGGAGFGAYAATLDENALLERAAPAL